MVRQSRVYYDDNGRRIEEVVFLMFAGKGTPALVSDITFVKPDHIERKQSCEVSLNIDECLIETSTETLTRLTRTLPYFKSIQQFDDLHQNRLIGLAGYHEGTALDNRTLFRRIKMQVPLYYVKKMLITQKTPL